ncbi:MAG: 2Fe-2S iron-sulfur cluster-binding protein [Gammaproteobacteria bacterium]
MPRVTYVTGDGREIGVEVAVGDSVLDGALDNGVPGIIGQCGGGCTCATCHCMVNDDWAARLPAPHPDEVALLAYVLDRASTSRLACQIMMTEALDGLVVRIPSRQL